MRAIRQKAVPALILGSMLVLLGIIAIPVLWTSKGRLLVTRASDGTLINTRLADLRLRFGPPDAPSSPYTPDWPVTYTQQVSMDEAIVVAVRTNATGLITETAVFDVNDDVPSHPIIKRR